MNGIIKIAIIAAILTLLGACSGDSGGGNTNVTVSSGNLSNNPPLSNISNQMIPYPGPGNTGGAPPGSSDATVVNVDPKKLKPTNPAVPAADNSEVLTVLNEKGAMETRVFKSHPVLAKIEKTTYGREVQVRVFLKNGKVIPLAPEKIGNFITDSAQQILQAAAVVQPPPQQQSKPAQNAGTGAATGTKTDETKDSQANRPEPTPKR